MQLRLGGDDVREDPALTGYERRRRLVTRGLETKDHAGSCSNARNPVAYGVLPHDQGILAVIGVVAATHSPSFEAKSFVQPDRARVRDADLERVAAATVR